MKQVAAGDVVGHPACWPSCRIPRVHELDGIRTEVSDRTKPMPIAAWHPHESIDQQMPSSCRGEFRLAFMVVLCYRFRLFRPEGQQVQERKAEASDKSGNLTTVAEHSNIWNRWFFCL